MNPKKAHQSLGRDVNTHHQDAAAAIDAAAARLGSRFHEGATWQRRVHGAGRRSHYSYNEIIMTGALRPHHRNIYCIIYSASPLVQGERTHINLQARPLGSSLRLLFAREPTLLFALFLSGSFFPPYLLLTFFGVFFLFVLLLLFFFSYLPSKPRRRDGPSAPLGPQHSCGRTLPAPSVFSLFFYYLLFFCFFLGSKDLFFSF